VPGNGYGPNLLIVIIFTNGYGKIERVNRHDSDCNNETGWMQLFAKLQSMGGDVINDHVYEKLRRFRAGIESGNLDSLCLEIIAIGRPHSVVH
jgi:hypothetical protein